MQDFFFILLAGGSSSRFGGPVPKPFLLLKDKKVIQYSLEILSTIPPLQQCCIVLPPRFIESTYSICTELNIEKKIVFALPGKRRQDSVLNALAALNTSEGVVGIHDAARPLITSSLVESLYQKAKQHGAAIPCVPVKSTIKVVNEQGFVVSSPTRSALMEAQTPQCFNISHLKRAYQSADLSKDYFDDAMVMEMAECAPFTVNGCYRNIKITTPEDLAWAAHLMESRSE